MKKKVIQDRKNNMNKGKKKNRKIWKQRRKLQVVWFPWSVGGRKIE